MSNSQEKRVTRLAQAKGYRLEKVGKGPHYPKAAVRNCVHWRVHWRPSPGSSVRG